MAEDDLIPEPDRVDGYPHPRETVALHGQSGAERMFLDAWAGGRMHHAWLLRGPQGIGKATLAYRIARALIAQPADQGAGLFGDGPETPTTLDTPPDCPLQARILARAEPRLFVLNRRWDADKKRIQAQISVDDVRAVRRFLNLSATDGGWRVVIVDSADEMNRNSANALLKFLEEPPAQTVFLLVSHVPSGLLPTIRSRCRTLDLVPLTPTDLAAVLAMSEASVPAGDAAALAELGGGSAGQALRLLSTGGVTLYGEITAALGGGAGVDRPAMIRLAESCAGRAAVDRYLSVLGLSQTLLARLARTAATGTTPAEAAPGEAQLFATAAHSPAQAAEWAETLARISTKTRHAVAVNLDPAQCVIDTFLEIDAALERVRRVAA